MIRYIICMLTSVLLFSCGSAKRLNTKVLDTIPFEQDKNTTATYQETSSFYTSLAKASKYVQVNEYGITDAGHPLQEVIIDVDRKFTPEKARQSNKAVLFINNGIHPGEPCGVDASMLLCKDILKNKNLFQLLDNVIIVIIPIYNIGGAKNRNRYTRTNQQGPDSHGFRGNAKNLDLNRDFVKNDSQNAQSFVKLFTKWMPEVFIDTHTSNGANYQHIITLIATQKNKLAPALGSYLEYEFLPKIYQEMYEDGYDMSPYVYAVGSTPDEQGIMAFPDLPRYSSGFAALHHSLSFMPETHMLKTFEERVMSTRALLEKMLIVTHQEKENILKRKQQGKTEYANMNEVPISWTLDKSYASTTSFKGYESGKKPSKISGKDRLYYDESKPFTKDIPLYDEFKVNKKVVAPVAYVIPQAYAEIIERLEWNGVEVTRLEMDEMIDVEAYYIEKFESTKFPYESHYLHYNTTIKKQRMDKQFFAGDYRIEVDQASKRFIIETLEPEAPDSYFNWNFFDGILMQKEHFSSYVFEDLAAEILVENPDIKVLLEAKKKENEDFANSAYQQLEFIYKRSKYYEKTHNLYPVARVMK